MIIEKKNINNINKYDTIIDKTFSFFYYSKYINPKFRVNLLRKEIIKNLPKISISIKVNDLFIFIRSGDIFVKPYSGYKQPPLCFYKKVIDNYLFKTIYLIAINKNNPVINELLKNYPNIIYNYNSLKVDMSNLVNAYNIAGGPTSTFFSRIIELNNNLQFLWTFKFQTFPFKKNHKSNLMRFYKFKGTKIFFLYSSKKYIIKMKIWRNTKNQRDLMLKEHCLNPFVFY